MGANRPQLRYLGNVKDFIKQRCDIDMTIGGDTHPKVELSNRRNGKKCLWVVGGTPSDRNAAMEAAKTLRKLIRQKLGADCHVQSLSEFPMSDVVPGLPEPRSFEETVADLMMRD